MNSHLMTPNNFAPMSISPISMPLLDLSGYPWQCLPLGMRSAVQDVHFELQAPLPLVAMSAMSAVSLACQDLADVQLHHGKKAPLSLNMLAIADSGDRKTAVDAKFMQIPKAYEQQLQESYSAAKKRYQAEFAVWKAEEKALCKKIANSKFDSNSDLTARMADLLNTQPVRPQRPVLLVQDATPEALIQALSHQRSLGLISDEAGIILNGRVTEQLPMLNALWDGARYNVQRKTMDDITLSNVRLTIGLMLQNKPFEKFLKSQGEQALDNGFLARFLIAKPMSMQGHRIDYEYPISSDASLTQFNAKMIDVFARKKCTDTEDRPVLEFSKNALCALRNFSNDIEVCMRPGGYYSHVKSAASKIVENAERMAGLFHVFENAEGEISFENTSGAIAICRWHLNEFHRIFTPAPEIDKKFQHAKELDNWLRSKARFDANYGCLKNDILRVGPYSVRKKQQLEQALSVLIFNKIAQVGEYQPRGPKMVFLNPNSLPLFSVTC